VAGFCFGEKGKEVKEIVRRVLLVLTVAALMVAALTITAAGAFAAPQSEHGHCGVGGPGSGAFGCAGNVGGFIATPNGQCKEINQGPFSVFEGFCGFSG
jgi:hypothetical protein